MKRILMASMILAAPALAAAQAAGPGGTYDGSYYAMFTTGGCQHGYPFFGVAGGAEALVWKGLSVGADASFQQFRNSFSFGLATLQAGYHFRGKNRAATWDPFVSVNAGVGLAKRVTGSGSLGGGFTRWTGDRVGVRFESRLQAFGPELLVTFRVGVSFR